MAAAGVFAVLIAAVTIRNIKRSMAQDTPRIAAADRDDMKPDDQPAGQDSAESAESSGSVDSESDPAKEDAESNRSSGVRFEI